MKYETYLFLTSLIDKEQRQLERDFQNACSFIPRVARVSRKPSGVDMAHKIFRERSKSLDDMKDELHDSAASAYKNHPNPDMRKFWGLE